MAMSLDELTNSLVTDTYTPRTDDELQTAANNRYASVYNQKRLTANQHYQTSDLAYQNQMNQLADSLAYSQQQIQKNTADSIAAANRSMVSRGMQRSSYAAANEARIAAAGTTNLANLLREYNTNANSIQTNRTLLAQQLADTLASYDVDMQNDILSYIDEQKQLDYERQLAATQYKNSILMDLYQYGQAQKSGGGGGSSRRSGSGGGNGGNQTPYSQADLDKAVQRAISIKEADASKAANDAARAAAVSSQRANTGVKTSSSTKKQYADYVTYHSSRR